MSEQPKEVLCPYCGVKAEFVDSARVYRGKSYGMIYDCRPCNAYVGVHHGTANPLGTMADKETRVWRMRAHEAFDPLWKSNKMSRSAAYAEMSRRLGIPPEQAHISHMDAGQCQRVVNAFSDARPNASAPVARQCRDHSLPACGCTHVPPWVHCQHTLAACNG